MNSYSNTKKNKKTYFLACLTIVLTLGCMKQAPKEQNTEDSSNPDLTAMKQGQAEYRLSQELPTVLGQDSNGKQVLFDISCLRGRKEMIGQILSNSNLTQSEQTTQIQSILSVCQISANSSSNSNNRAITDRPRYFFERRDGNQRGFTYFTYTYSPWYFVSSSVPSSSNQFCYWLTGYSTSCLSWLGWNSRYSYTTYSTQYNSNCNYCYYYYNYQDPTYGYLYYSTYGLYYYNSSSRINTCINSCARKVVYSVGSFYYY